jgi:predicted Rossmann fold flavoprotein
MKKIVVIGGGAAGFFAALSAKIHYPENEVIIYEKLNKVLSKVKISGGGRCNVTHACFDNKELASKYPRGENYLRKAFEQFNANDTIEWFKKRGILLKTYPDGCIFPQSNDSQTIIDCFQGEAKRLGVKVMMNQSIHKISKSKAGFELITQTSKINADKVIITTGGQPKKSGMLWLEDLGHSIIEPVPSLFTFNMPGNSISTLMGNVVEKATVKVEGTKLIGKGPLLITHWGMSGPAILLLSAWGARILNEKNYQFAILVNWLDEMKDLTLREMMSEIMKDHSGKMIGNLNPFPVTNRMWHYLLEKSEIHLETRWKDLGKKNVNKLVNTLLNDRYQVSGKTTFKEEFVTAGGVALTEVDFKTMESKVVSGLYFAGEILDIDGITGGFNFQAAWTTGFIAGKHSGNRTLEKS